MTLHDSASREFRFAMLARIEQLASGRNVLIALVAMLLGGALLFNLGPYADVVNINPMGVLPEETFGPVDGLTQFLAGLDQVGRDVYFRHLLLDFLNPLLMGTFFALALLWLGELSRLRAYSALLIPALLILPLLLMLAELLENSVLILAVISFPDPTPGLGVLTLATPLKFLALGLSALACVLLALAASLRKLLGR